MNDVYLFFFALEGKTVKSIRLDNTFKKHREQLERLGFVYNNDLKKCSDGDGSIVEID